MARNWFGRKTSEDQIAGLESYYAQPGGWRLWVRRLVGVLAALVLLFAFVWAGAWVYRSVANTGDETATKSTNQTDTSKEEKDSSSDSTPATDTIKKPDSTASGTTDTTNGTSSTAGSTTGTSGTSSTSTTNTSNLPKTGDDSGDTPNGASPDVLPSTGG